MSRVRIMIWGAPRSGTKYMATALASLGLDVGHEKMGADGGVGYNFTYTKNCPPLADIDFCAVLARDPRQVIPSMEANLDASSWEDVDNPPRWIPHPTEHIDKHGGFEPWYVHHMRESLSRLHDAEAAGCETMIVPLESPWEFFTQVVKRFALTPNQAAFTSVSNQLNHRREYTPRTIEQLSPDSRALAQVLGYLTPAEQR